MPGARILHPKYSTLDHSGLVVPEERTVTKRKVSNPLALAVMACLAERPMHPYEMATTLRDRAKDESIKLNYGSLYNVVESLQRHGLIEPRETVKDARRPERTIYCLTDAGSHEFTDWLTELVSTPVKEYTQYEAGLSLLAGLDPDDAVVALELRCRHLEQEIAGMDSIRQLATSQELPRLFWIEAEYRTAQQEAELEWTRKLITDISGATLEGIEFWRTYHQG
jgi:DNA-binding PadR family transcriptional regulator